MGIICSWASAPILLTHPPPPPVTPRRTTLHEQPDAGASESVTAPAPPPPCIASPLTPLFSQQQIERRSTLLLSTEHEQTTPLLRRRRSSRSSSSRSGFLLLRLPPTAPVSLSPSVRPSSCRRSSSESQTLGAAAVAAAFYNSHHQDLNQLFLPFSNGTLWRDSAIQETYVRGNELQLPDCAHFFMENLQRLSDIDYVPTKEDVLYARVRTTGVVEIQFSPVGENKKSGEVYRLFDVGGQKNERRKWIHLFEGVSAVIFCAAISEYDQTLFDFLPPKW
ncbi:uncharacterized protein LOC131009950 [Salvia miltiorrhiza]|uniref:uncharacterized protein LOC131009950 n=1 Tax=Salvia miltiorrhiza TaxID=226208 RepID=UPI0025AD7EFF|nr:uncharacterized protein LOC131009950 [Salvia miltiorrhiza]